MLTVVVPVLDDDVALARLISWLDAYNLNAIVVDGGLAGDVSRPLAQPHRRVHRPPSRGGQVAAGVKLAHNQWVWVLHADTQPSAAAYVYLQQVIAAQHPVWGRFDITLEGLPWLAWFMNWRSRLTKICTGDQGMFFHQSLLHDVGGYPDLPLMEDVEVSRRLKRLHKKSFRAPKLNVEASTRRWRQRGIVLTIFSMWSFRWQYYFGVKAETLAAKYYDA